MGDQRKQEDIRDRPTDAILKRIDLLEEQRRDCLHDLKRSLAIKSLVPEAFEGDSRVSSRWTHRPSKPPGSRWVFDVSIFAAGEKVPESWRFKQAEVPTILWPKRLQDAKGVEAKIKKCFTCKGSAIVEDLHGRKTTCHHCDGHGVLQRNVLRCGQCRGAGVLPYDGGVCLSCNGEGIKIL